MGLLIVNVEIVYKDLLNKYVEFRKKEFEKLFCLPIPVFKTLSLNCSEIAERSTDWFEEIQREGISPKSSVLYYLTIKEGNGNKIQQLVYKRKQRYKSRSKNYKALPKVNFIEGNLVMYST
ncbi:MAG: hypothetical protein EOP48_07510 [Sphingobacteriales bacterium]|nr:MAG: hypothetical protein EOP48_07510 [Sphingobacteriales bacterium]